MNPTTGLDSFTQIATVRIALKDSDPPIWRMVEVPTSVTLKVLHDIIQVTMGWFDYHLWEMVVEGQTYGLPMDEDWGTAQRRPASRTRLRNVLRPDNTTIDYVYDFGDNWKHIVSVSDVRAADVGNSYPRFIAGERECPPEDCGGISDFYEMLQARDDPDHPEHVQVREWLDGFGPEDLDVSLIDVALKRIAARRNAAAKRIMKSANA
jgi:hypothetical protein